MSRLSDELRRLFLPAEADAGAGTTARLADADGRLRALVLDLRAPADWSALARVWQGVQADLGWPAPAIAVSGGDGVQLWFALAQPVDAATGDAVLQALVRRHLADLPPHRLRRLPGPDGWQPAAVPALQGADSDGERWSAFVSADLAPMFSDTPWLDIPPNPDGQAALLAPLRPVTPEELQRLLAAERPAPAPSPAPSAAVTPEPAPSAPASTATGLAAAGPFTDPRAFLLAVMNDGAAPLALRIEAARALLPVR